MSHLSELSVQLRKLQAEKNAQANEIDRLQRQLRILSELKGISIEDLMSALKAACEADWRQIPSFGPSKNYAKS